MIPTINRIKITPLIGSSLEGLLHLYLSEGYIKWSSIFGLNDFGVGELILKCFDRVGDDFFSLFEKGYSLKGSEAVINLKLYFHNEIYISNGLDVANVRISTILQNYSQAYGQCKAIKKVQLYMDESGDFGSLVVNDHFDIRFGRRIAGSQREKFHLYGISTDYAVDEEWTKKHIETRHAKNTKHYIDIMNFQKNTGKAVHCKSLLPLC